MSTIADLRPGDLGFTNIRGATGLGISLGELLLGDGFRIGRLDVRHVFVVTEGLDSNVMPWAVEAMPGGAVEVGIAERWTPQYAYARLPEDYPGQAADAAAIARAMIGTPYSFASYAALAAWRFGWKTPKLEAWIDRRRPAQRVDGAPTLRGQERDGKVFYTRELPAEAICSVLADQAWALTGKQVMPAGTPHQCVTPGGLARALMLRGDVQWMWPQ